MHVDKFNHYIKNFYGYGTWKSDIWFLGKEEGGGKKMESCFKKIEKFYEFARDRNNLLDLKDFHLTLDAIDARWFMPNFPLQSTWKLYIYLLSDIDCFQNLPCRKEFQSLLLGRDELLSTHLNNDYKKHAIIELLPLPNPYDDNEWPNRWPIWEQQLEGLENPILPHNKDDYRELFIPRRIDFIAQKIIENSPRYIISPTVGNNEYDTYFDTLINHISPEGVWNDAIHANGYISKFIDITLNNSKLRIIRTYNPAHHIAGGISWEDFYITIRDLCN